MTRTEAAIQAYVAALTAVTAAAVFPAPSRNEVLISLLDDIGVGGDGARINVLDGVGETDDEMLGADAGASSGYELIQRLEVECVALAKLPATRDSLFDAMLEYTAVAVETDRTLGGVVSYAAIESIAREHIRVEGLPRIKGGIITVALSFTSSRPF